MSHRLDKRKNEMAQSCAEHLRKKELLDLKKQRANKQSKDFSISEYEDPWENPDNRVDQWVTKVGPRKGQINQKIVSGPDRGVHRWINPKTLATGQTGITRKVGKPSEYRQEYEED